MRSRNLLTRFTLSKAAIITTLLLLGITTTSAAPTYTGDKECRIAIAGEMSGLNANDREAFEAMEKLNVDYAMLTGDYGDVGLGYNEFFDGTLDSRWNGTRGFSQDKVYNNNITSFAKFGDHDNGDADPYLGLTTVYAEGQTWNNTEAYKSTGLWESNAGVNPDSYPDYDEPHYGMRESGSYQMASIETCGVHIIYLSDLPSHKQMTQEHLDWVESELEEHQDRTSYVFPSKFSLEEDRDPSNAAGTGSGEEPIWTGAMWDIFEEDGTVQAIFNSDDEVAYNNPDSGNTTQYDWNQIKLHATKGGDPAGYGDGDYTLNILDLNSSKAEMRGYDVIDKEFRPVENTTWHYVDNVTMADDFQYEVDVSGSGAGSGVDAPYDHHIENNQTWTLPNHFWADNITLQLEGLEKKEKLVNHDMNLPLPQNNSYDYDIGYRPGFNTWGATDGRGESHIRFDSRNYDSYGGEGPHFGITTDNFQNVGRAGADDQAYNIVAVEPGVNYTAGWNMSYNVAQQNEPNITMQIWWMNSTKHVISKDETVVDPVNGNTDADRTVETMTGVAPQDAETAAMFVGYNTTPNSSVQQIVEFDGATFYETNANSSDGSIVNDVMVNGERVDGGFTLAQGETRNISIDPAHEWNFSMDIDGSTQVKYELQFDNIHAIAKNGNGNLTGNMGRINTEGYATEYQNGEWSGVGKEFFVKGQEVSVHGRNSVEDDYSRWETGPPGQGDSDNLNGLIATETMTGFDVELPEGNITGITWEDTTNNWLNLSIKERGDETNYVEINASKENKGRLRVNASTDLGLQDFSKENYSFWANASSPRNFTVYDLNASTNYTIYTDGANRTLVETDENGTLNFSSNMSQHKFKIVREDDKPELTLSLSSSSLNTGESVTISCSRSDESGIQSSNLTVTDPDGNNYYPSCGDSFSQTSTPGTYTVKYNATDGVGKNNSITKTFSVTQPASDDEDDNSYSGGGGGATIETNPSSTHSWVGVNRNQFQMTPDKETGIQNISVETTENKSNFEINVEKLKQKPEEVEEPDGESYSYMQIDVSASDEEVQNSVIEFSVNQSFAENHDVVLSRYNNEEWNDLPTRPVEQEGKEWSYKASSSGFSYYSIRGETTRDTEENQTETENNQTQQQNETTQEEQETGNQTTQQPEQNQTGNTDTGQNKKQIKVDKKVPILAGLLILLIVGAAYWKREEMKKYFDSH